MPQQQAIDMPGLKPRSSAVPTSGAACPLESNQSFHLRGQSGGNGMQILLDGHDIRGLELHWLRSNIGLVGQEPLLFSCSIRENICYGCPEATEEQVLSAAADSNALTFIQQLPEGLDTQVRHIRPSARGILCLQQQQQSS